MLVVHEEEVMSDMLEGGCACGEVRYRLASEPLFTHCCHCLNCQRQTGSAFVINLLIEADRVELFAGEPQPVDVPRGGGKKQRIFRCPICRVAVFSRYTRAGIRFVRGGTLEPCGRATRRSCRCPDKRRRPAPASSRTSASSRFSALKMLTACMHSLSRGLGAGRAGVA